MSNQYVQAGIVKNLLKKITNWGAVISNVASPIKAFDKTKGDIELDESSGIITSTIDLKSKPDIVDSDGKSIDCVVSLQATNIKDIIGDFMNAMLEVKNEGANIADYLPDEYFYTKNQDGLMDIILSETTDPLPKCWQDFANSLTYNLKCESTGRDSGEIQGQNLSNCVKLVSEYFTKTGISEFISEVRLDPNLFVLPICGKTQQWISDYLTKLGLTALNPSDDAESDSSSDSTSEDVSDNPNNTDVTNSKKITVTLQKIQGSTEILSLGANYTPGLALSDLDEILEDDAFTSTLTSEPQTYEITSLDDEFIVNVNDGTLVTMPEESLAELFSYAIKLYRNLYMLHWLSYGDDMSKLHLLSEELYSELIKQVDTIGELLVEKTGTIPDIHQVTDTFEIKNYTFQEGIVILADMIQGYIDIIDITYPNQASDVQSILDDWLRYWNKQLSYFIKRQLSE